MLFPHPDGPMNEVTLLRKISSEIEFRTSFLPYAKLKSLTSMALSDLDGLFFFTVGFVKEVTS